MSRCGALCCCLLLIAASTAAAAASVALSRPSDALGEWSKPEFCGVFECPPYKSKEKTEDWELRSYGAGKWIVTNVSDTRFPLAYAKGSSRLMKYFKGSNTEEKTFNLTTPTLAELKPKEGGKGKQGNYSFSLWLPTELQKDTPEPTDAELKVIEYPSMEVYVRVFSGFATEGRALDEASTLMDTLDEEGRDFGEDVVWLAVYDPPQKLQQRHNEVHIPAGKSQPQGQPVAAA